MLLDVFSEHGVPSADLEKARLYQSRHGGRLDQILVNMGSLPSEDLPAIYSRWFGVPVLAEADFRDWQLPAGSEELPLGFLLDHGWLPWEQGADGWIFATSSPCDLEVNAWLAESGSGTELLLLSLDDFEALKARLGIQNRESQLDGLSLVEEDRLRELASEAPTVNLLNSLTAKALRRGASDMHIEPHGERARVRFRIDGVLHDIDTISKAMVLPVITRLKILAGMDIAERRRPQDGKIELRIGGEDVDIRVSALPLRDGGESAVLRFLRKAALIYDMSLLGLSPDIEARILEDLRVTSGVVLLTGPTGSGKTTSLYTFLSRLNSPDVKIITLEDPVEYQLQGINQVQVQPDIGFDFARGLRSIVRQEPMMRRARLPGCSTWVSRSSCSMRRCARSLRNVSCVGSAIVRGRTRARATCCPAIGSSPSQSATRSTYRICGRRSAVRNAVTRVTAGDWPSWSICVATRRSRPWTRANTSSPKRERI
jgi:general secretion pathway protein E